MELRLRIDLQISPHKRCSVRYYLHFLNENPGTLADIPFLIPFR
jgi:hypothetical protein